MKHTRHAFMQTAAVATAASEIAALDGVKACEALAWQNAGPFTDA